MALRESSFNETQTNTIDWRKVFEARSSCILNKEEGNDKLHALRLFILKYLVHNLQNWENQEIEEELLIIAHVLHIEITGHARLENNAHKELFAHIISSEIYNLLDCLHSE